MAKGAEYYIPQELADLVIRAWLGPKVEIAEHLGNDPDPLDLIGSDGIKEGSGKNPQGGGGSDDGDRL